MRSFGKHSSALSFCARNACGRWTYVRSISSHWIYVRLIYARLIYVRLIYVRLIYVPRIYGRVIRRSTAKYPFFPVSRHEMIFLPPCLCSMLEVSEPE